MGRPGECDPLPWAIPSATLFSATEGYARFLPVLYSYQLISSDSTIMEP